MVARSHRTPHGESTHFVGWQADVRYDTIRSAWMDRPDRSAIIRELVAETLTARARKATR